MDASLNTGGSTLPNYQALQPHLQYPLIRSLTFLGPPLDASGNDDIALTTELADVRKVRFLLGAIGSAVTHL